MTTKLALTTVPKECAAEPSKKKRERIGNVETTPNPDWFVSTREQGRTVWYLRFRVTGMFPRRFGPFASRHKALLALDAMLGSMVDQNSGFQSEADAYRLKRTFQQTWGPVIEDDLALPKGGIR